MKKARMVSTKLRPRAAFSLFEMTIVCGFLSIILVLLAGIVHQFFRSRDRVADADQQSRLLRGVLLNLRRDVGGCYQLDQVTPDLRLRSSDQGDTARLPQDFPTPIPASSPPWDPSAGLLAVRYHYDPANSTLLREVTFSNGQISQQRIAEQIQAFSVTNTTDRDIQVSISAITRRGTTLHHFKVRRFEP